MPDSFVVGPTGLPLWRYLDWRVLQEQRWRAGFGADADTRPETPDGLVIDTFALADTLHHDGLQTVWANSFFRTCSGVSLDLLLDLFARQRFAARPTVVQGIWWGDIGAQVHDGVGLGPVALVITTGETDGDRYVVDAGQAGQCSDHDDDGALFAYQIIRGVSGDDYAIEFDATPTLITAATDSPVAIAQQLADEIMVDYPTMTATAWELPDLSAIIIVSGKGAEQVDVGGDSTDPGNLALWGAVQLPMSAETLGPQVLIAGTLLEIGTPGLTGVEGVVNIADGTTGRNRETDQEYRQRHIDRIQIGGKATPQRIRAALLELEDASTGALLVEFCRVDQNKSDAVDSEGRPPHSYEVTVIGDATDLQVAQVILDTGPAGIQAYGDTVVEVEDEQGEPQEIGLTSGTEIYLHLDITITAGEGFPDEDPTASILEALVEYLEDTLALGQDFYMVMANLPILSTVQGVASIVVETATTLVLPGAPVFSAVDVTVGTQEILRIESDRISITLA